MGALARPDGGGCSVPDSKARVPACRGLHRIRSHPGTLLSISVQSSTQPCTGLADGKYVCNALVITASCVTPLSAQVAR
jgi:hypothetical protein